MDNILVEMSEEGEPQEVHIIDFGLACSVGFCHPQTSIKICKSWYCPCFFNGTPMQARCDVLSVAYIISYFRDLMSEEYKELDELLLRASDDLHGKRPSLEELIAHLQKLLRELDGILLPACPQVPEEQQPAAAEASSGLAVSEASATIKPADLSEMCKAFRRKDVFRKGQ